MCFNESLFTNDGKALGAESSARGCFVEKKILYFRKAFGEKIILEDYFPGTVAKCKMKHFPTRLDSF